MAKKTGFNRQEREIIRTLYSERRPMSLRELSKLSKTSWATTKKYAKELNKRGFVDFMADNKNKKVKFNFNIF